jgi:hypothetical protein
MAEFKAITTQEEFNAAISERLIRQKETIEANYKNYNDIVAENERLKNELAENKSALENSTIKLNSLTNDLEEMTTKVNGYELEKMKTTIALQNGIPFGLASRLVGSTEDEILQDAKSLSEMVSQQKNTAPLKSTEPVDLKDSGYKSLLGNLNLEGE